MNIRILFAHVIMCGIITLAGCSSKEAVKIDTTPGTVATTAAAAGPAESKGTSGHSTGDTIVAASNTPLAGGGQKIDEVGADSALNPIFFDFDSCILTADARKIIAGHAGWLDGNRFSRIIIEGHTDERGSDTYNLALGEKRAIAARRYLETLGVNGDRMEIISYGEEKRSATGHDEQAWAKNRRVEFVIIK